VQHPRDRCGCPQRDRHYHRAPDQKSKLRAESNEIHRSAKTGTYEIKVTDERDTLIASCTALCYRKKEKLPFLEKSGTGGQEG